MAITINGSGITSANIADGTIAAADLANTYLTPTGDGSGLSGIESVIKQPTAPSALDGSIWFDTDNYTINVKLNNEWLTLAANGIGASTSNPGASAEAIYTAGAWTGDGFYYISTPNGGIQRIYCINDTNGSYMVVGKFAGNAMSSVQETIPTNHGVVSDISGTVFSSSFGDLPCNEVRFVGTNAIEGNWVATRNIDFIHGIDGKAWKNVFYESSHTSVSHPTSPTSTAVKPGYWCTYAKDGRGRWDNPDYRAHAMSDGYNQITQAAFTAPGSFYMEQSADAKFTVCHTGDRSGQDGIVTAGFGNDDNIEGFFDLNTGTTTNMQGGNTYSTAVYVLIR